MTADDIIARLNLAPHPEGGWYRQTWAAPDPADTTGRALATCIHFLLRGDECSHWHRVDADEIWLWHAGAPLVLSVSATDQGPAREYRLGGQVLAGEAPQVIVPAQHWQSARSLGDSGPGDYSLVSCVVSPGFRFAGFTLAAAGFDIPRA